MFPEEVISLLLLQNILSDNSWCKKLFMNRTCQSFVFTQLSQKTERQSVKTFIYDALHERLLLDTENTYVTVSSSSV